MTVEQDNWPFPHGARVRPKDNPIRSFTVDHCEKVVLHGGTRWVVYGPMAVRHWAEELEVLPAEESQQPVQNTDIELWREHPGSYYSPKIHLTVDGRIGINVGGTVHEMTLREWHALVPASVPEIPDNSPLATQLEQVVERVDKRITSPIGVDGLREDRLRYIDSLNVIEFARGKGPLADGLVCTYCHGCGMYLVHAVGPKQCAVCLNSSDEAYREAATLRMATHLEVLDILRKRAALLENEAVAEAVARLRSAIISDLNADGEPIPAADMIDCGVRYIKRLERELEAEVNRVSVSTDPPYQLPKENCP